MAALMPLIAPEVRAAKRLVVKIGSALLVDRKAGLRQGWLSALAMDVAEAVCNCSSLMRYSRLLPEPTALVRLPST